VDRVLECQSVQAKQFTELLDCLGIAKPFDVDPGDGPLTNQRMSRGGVRRIVLSQVARPINDHMNLRLRLRWIGNDNNGRRARRAAADDLWRMTAAMLAAHAAFASVKGWADLSGGVTRTSTGRSTFRCASRCGYAITM